MPCTEQHANSECHTNTRSAPLYSRRLRRPNQSVRTLSRLTERERVEHIAPSCSRNKPALTPAHLSPEPVQANPHLASTHNRHHRCTVVILYQNAPPPHCPAPTPPLPIPPPASLSVSFPHPFPPSCCETWNFPLLRSSANPSRRPQPSTPTVYAPAYVLYSTLCR